MKIAEVTTLCMFQYYVAPSILGGAMPLRPMLFSGVQPCLCICWYSLWCDTLTRLHTDNVEDGCDNLLCVCRQCKVVHIMVRITHTHKWNQLH